MPVPVRPSLARWHLCTASGPEAEASVNNSTEDSGGTAYYSGSGNAEGEEKADDTVTVNENNPNIQERVPEGVQ